MSYPNQEGPINGIRPVEFYKTCTGCKYHEHNLWRSGTDPIYTDKCTHESAPNHKKDFLSFNDLDNQNGYPEPGEWCPFEAVNKIDLV